MVLDAGASYWFVPEDAFFAAVAAKLQPADVSDQVCVCGCVECVENAGVGGRWMDGWMDGWMALVIGALGDC